MDLANKLLDEVIPNRGSDGFRTLPSGESFVYSIGATPAFGPWPDVAEQAARFFKAVGVNAEAKISERSLFTNQWRSNQLHAAVFQQDRTADLFVWPTHATCNASNCWWGSELGRWIASDGEVGVEPSDEHKQLVEWYKQGLKLSPEESAPLAQNIYKWHAENQVESVVILPEPHGHGSGRHRPEPGQRSRELGQRRDLQHALAVLPGGSSTSSRRAGGGPRMPSASG